jgi:WD40 repeat protein
MQMGLAYVHTPGAPLRLAGVSLDGTITFYNAADGAVANVWRGHASRVGFIGACAGVCQFVSGGADGKLLAWTIDANGVPQCTGAMMDFKTEALQCGTVCGANAVLVTGSKAYTAPVPALSPTPTKPTAEGVASTVCAALPAVGLVVFASRTTLIVLDAVTGAKVAESDLKLTSGGDITALAGVAGGANTPLIAVGCSKAVFVYEYNIATKSFTKKAEYSAAAGSDTPHRNGVISALAFNPTGSLLASGDADKTIAVWDLVGAPAGGATAKNLYDGLVFHSARITSLAFVSEAVLASGSLDGAVIFWDLPAGSRRMATTAHAGGVTALAVVPTTPSPAAGEGAAPASVVVVSGGADGSLRLWK